MISPRDLATPRAVRCHPTSRGLFRESGSTWPARERDRGREESRGWIVAVAGRPGIDRRPSDDAPAATSRCDATRGRGGDGGGGVVGRGERALRLSADSPSRRQYASQLAVVRRVRLFRGARNYAGSRISLPSRFGITSGRAVYSRGARGAWSLRFGLLFLVTDESRVSFPRITSRGIIIIAGETKPAIVPSILAIGGRVRDVDEYPARRERRPESAPFVFGSNEKQGER